MAKPDLIELSTDWNTALVVADRYGGLGGGSEADRYFTEQGKRVLAAVLLIANKRGEGYRWVDEALRDDQLMSEIIQGGQSASHGKCYLGSAAPVLGR